MESTIDFQLAEPEWAAVTALRSGHRKEFGDSVRAMIVFGSLSPLSRDIDLLEVIDDWTGPNQIQFSSSSNLPLRGILRLHVLSTDQFENPASIEDTETRRWVLDLLSNIRRSNIIVAETPPGYAITILETPSTVGFLNSSRPPIIGKDPMHIGKIARHSN